MPLTTKTRTELLTDAIRRFRALQDSVTYFGGNGVARALLGVAAEVGAASQQLYLGLQRRYSLLGAEGSGATGGDLDRVLEEHGAPRPGANRGRVVVAFRPWAATVTAITTGATDLIEVDDSSRFADGDSIRIRSDAATTEIATIIAITTGTGPNGGDELEVATLSNTYDPTTENVEVLLREVLAAGTELNSLTGARFQLLASVTVGDANPIFSGESSALALLDKGWAECTERGSIGAIEAGAITGFVTPNANVRSATNPEAAIGGQDAADDASARYRAAYLPSLLAVETQAAILALCQRGNIDVLRTRRVTPTALRTVSVRVLHRNVGPLSTDEKDALKAYVDQYMRAGDEVEILDVSLTSLEISASITLDGSRTLRQVWRDVASRVVTRVDTRTWEFGQDVERAMLITLVRLTPGIATLNSETFTPLTDLAVGADSLPVLVTLTLTDSNSGTVITDDVTVSF
jgi:hypothetical protein